MKSDRVSTTLPSRAARLALVHANNFARYSQHRTGRRWAALSADGRGFWLVIRLTCTPESNLIGDFGIVEMLSSDFGRSRMETTCAIFKSPCTLTIWIALGVSSFHCLLETPTTPGNCLWAVGGIGSLEGDGWRAKALQTNLAIRIIRCKNNRVIKVSPAGPYNLPYKLRVTSSLEYSYTSPPKFLYPEFLQTVNFFNILNIDTIISIY
jgi:hypothetical protein